MTSRLDRLILLLDTGSTSAIRATAAQQIGDIQKQHPQELANLLVRVARHLRSKQWETRVAAGLALEAIAQHVPEWCTRTDDDDRPSDAEEALSPPPSADGSVGTPHAAVTRSPTLTAHHASAWSFNRVDLPVVLAQGHSLLASAGKEYDFDLTDLDPAERMRLQRRRLAQNMGLGMQFDVGDLVEDADLNVTPTALHRPASVPIPPVVLRPGVAPTPTTAFHGAVPLAAIAPGASAIPPPGPRPRGRPRKHPPPPPKPTPLDDSVNPAYAHLDMTGLSARERNRLKRKAKKDGRTPAALNVITPDMQQGRDKMRIIESSQPSSGCPVPVAHRTPSEPSDSAPTSGNILDPDPTSEHSGPSQIDSNHSSISPSPRLTTPVPSSSEITSGQPFAVSSDHWPFTRIIDQLCLDLFDPDWEVRHGAGIGIKAILRKHGQSAARKMGCSPEVNDRRNQTYLLDIVVRIVCVLTLDRFCDFVSDQVVTPVRETCSQTLGTVCKFLSPEAVNEAMQALLKLVHQPWTHQAGRPMAMGRPLPTSPIWDVRYAGLLGLKYLVAVRQDLADQLLVGTVGAVHLGLQDSDDDVRAVSAATLIPMVDVLVTQLTAVVPGICRVLWDGLLELKDDLTPSIASVMELVSKLYRYEPLSAQQNGLAEGFESLIPRLYPFFRHTMTSVRQAVLETLLTFIRLAPHDPWVDDQWRAVDSRCLQLLYQNILLETHPRILQLSVEVWNAYIWRLVRCHRLAPTNQPPLLTQLIAPHLYHWLGWLVTPIGTPLSTTGMYSAPAPGHSKPRAGSAGLAEYQVHPVDTAMIQQDLGLVPIPVVFRNRTASARALGQCLAALTGRGFHQWTIATVLEEWGTAYTACRTRLPAPHSMIWDARLVQVSSPAALLYNTLLADLNLPLQALRAPHQGVPYSELLPQLQRIYNDSVALLQAFIITARVPHNKIPGLPPVFRLDQPPSSIPGVSGSIFTAEIGQRVVTDVFTQLADSIPPAGQTKAAYRTLDEHRTYLTSSLAEFQEELVQLQTRVHCAAAGALVALEILPDKLNPIIRSLMNSVKRETLTDLQLRAAVSVTRLCPSLPVEKIIKNLCTCICSDPAATPALRQHMDREGIWSVLHPDTPVTAEGENGAPDADSDGATPIPGAGDSAMAVTVRGATMALHQLATLFGPDLFAQLPRLWDTIARPLATVDAITASKDSAATDSIDLLNTRLAQTATEPASLGQELIDALQVIRTLVPALDSDLHPALLTLLPSICSVLRCQYMVIRFTTARCLASLAQVLLNPVLTATVRQVVPLLGHVEHLTQRQGAAEALYQIVTQLDDRILPFVIFLVVPVLGRMSDPDDSVRLVCTNGFAQLIKLVPLEAGVPDPPEMASDLLAHREHERKFLAQLMDSSQLEPFVIPVKISVTLRKYQQEGVSWLAFLNRYQLHGILCDDMGLGKTLQSICILASDHYHRAVRYAATKAPNSRPLASLVVCPPTLIGHWQQEILTYVDTLKPLIYAGPPLERRKLRPMFAQHDVIIMSYDVLRNDLDDLVHLHWNYCILDEGHVIKNTKTKITKAVKSVNALHRLILSGTPVQNNVVELWSLFDFLMPGFLGTERMFNDRYGKPILASRDSKSSSRDQEAGALALEALHKQVLPFLLRRMKEDVLSDLPPKIIQDYYCDLSDIQRQLYEDFSNSKTTQVIRRSLETGESYSALAAPEPVVQPAHVFQALQYLRKLVNHPLLVLNPKHAQYDTVMAQLRANQQQLRDLVHAPKLLALRQLLNDCGIGVSDPSSNTDSAVGALTEGAVSQHRALVFCQLKTMLDIVENDLLRVHMPGVTYMRLDGSVDSQKRQDVVTKFNQDPSIDLLLLTTHVGGLGLNLTGADTVIFIEHDWNPMKDLQAMDRAHRLGQKKVVNVYRLITRGTLEEKIMGLQKFKLNVANSIINQQNAGLQSMNTDQLLDLFSVSSTGAGANDTGKSDQGGANGDDKKPATAKNVLDNMDDLWDDRQYNEEYNLDAFIQSLN
ncbi:SNF2 family N-terminal domain-containing protein [Dimargaris cristalligena]|uniref:TATA-binding protein-associated factor mot1 n=1 Tax=Dimargaris cristalligena TaxID=215637 RepID=A0A4V1J5N7_9FUNG|nr:SNF2 family N-terminal domain-containing protein [Dimargaris cristalligena]|eukprot:RKP39699.1 SNF2 family N-terminal domain-containing protein [Dimargaris cristalligena]